MMRWTFIILTFIALTLPTYAQNVSCGLRTAIIAALASKSEVQDSVGLAADSQIVLEIYSSLDGASFTALLTMPDGKSCILLAGEAWQHVKRVELKKPSSPL